MSFSSSSLFSSAELINYVHIQVILRIDSFFKKIKIIYGYLLFSNKKLNKMIFL